MLFSRQRRRSLADRDECRRAPAPASGLTGNGGSGALMPPIRASRPIRGSSEPIRCYVFMRRWGPWHTTKSRTRPTSRPSAGKVPFNPAGITTCSGHRLPGITNNEQRIDRHGFALAGIGSTVPLAKKQMRFVYLSASC
jgi:hypothetical protein